MKVSHEQEIHNAIRDGIRDAVTKCLSSNYNNPLEKVVSTSITSQESKFRKLIDESIASCMVCDVFTSSVKAAVRQQLAKTLVQRFGGELEKQVNALKSDPTTRARIVLALEEIVNKATTT